MAMARQKAVELTTIWKDNKKAQLMLAYPRDAKTMKTTKLCYRKDDRAMRAI